MRILTLIHPLRASVLYVLRRPCIPGAAYTLGVATAIAHTALIAAGPCCKSALQHAEARWVAELS